MTNERERELLLTLVPMLCEERGMDAGLAADASVDELFATFRALVNTREPMHASKELLTLQDELLQGIAENKGVTHLEDLEPCGLDSRIRLWRGDITCLEVDAIVNAANNQLLGCWAPGHYCIDNAIHTFAGIQLRLACAELMRKQGHEEATGLAKVTPAFNLPSKYVIHTVGPIAHGMPAARHRVDLARCYKSCLDAAAGLGLGSIAFCCISTGVFGFPQADAAQIAVRSVRKWLAEHEGAKIDVVFNVFLAKDEALYRRLLSC